MTASAYADYTWLKTAIKVACNETDLKSSTQKCRHKFLFSTKKNSMGFE